MDYFAHSSACIDAPVSIGVATKIWHFCHVMSGARVGSECSLGQNVFVASDVVIGDRVKIQNNVSLYDGTRVEDDVFLGPSCVLTNVKNPRAEISRRTEFLPTVIRRGATVGANATIVCGVTIGPYAFIAAGAVVTHDVGAYELIVGVPGRRDGWMSRHGFRLEPTAEANVFRCPHSNFRYALTGDQIHCLDLSEDATLMPPSLGEQGAPT